MLTDPNQTVDPVRIDFPDVTVIVPTLNEQGCILDCLTSLLTQDAPISKILVIDGGSIDRTREVVAQVASRDSRVRLLSNPKRTAAAAMNVGLQATDTELIVRADAHALYETDYVRRSVDALEATGADNVGGPMRPVGTTRFGRAVAAVTTSRLAMGSAAFHWATSRRTVDTVYLGCYRTDTLRKLGGYDETNLQWAAEDQEINYRLRKRGGTIVCDPAVRSYYFPRETPAGLWRQYYNYGVCKASTLKRHHSLPTLRPLAPAGLVSGIVGCGTAAGLSHRRRFLAPVIVWLTALTAISARLARQQAVDAKRTFAAMAICQLSYGLGFWAGLGRIVRGRPFDSQRP